MYLILAALASAILVYYYFAKLFNYWREQGIQQTNPIWGLGDMWKVMFRRESTIDMVKSIYNRFPGTSYTGMYQFFEPVLMLKDADLIKQVTIKDFDHFVDHRSFFPEDVDPLWSKNLVGLQGDKWRDMRNLLSPSFTSSKLKTMFILIKEYADNVVNYVSKQNQDVFKIEARDFFTRITNDIIATTSFGINVDSLSQPNNSFYTMGKDFADLGKLRINLLFFGYMISKHFHKIIRIQLFSQETRTYFQNIIDESVRVRKETDMKRPDMIDLMIKAQKKSQKYENGVSDGHTEGELSKPTLTNEDMAAQAGIFFLGGFDTVSSLMTFASYELAMNPDIQTRLRKEIRDAIEECGGDVTYDVITKMKYLDMVISESLRKWPNFVMVDRQCTKDYVLEPQKPGEKPVHIKAGQQLLLPIYGIHHDPKYFPNPEKFDPERFSEENKGNIHPYAFLSFGLGPRSCIGMRFALTETKTILVHILSKFEIVPVEETDIPVKVSKKNFNLQAERLWLGLKRTKT